jgi:hypothetical protein
VAADKFGKYDMKMTIENSETDQTSGLDESSDLTDIVNYVLHDRSDDYSDRLIRASVHQNVSVARDLTNVIKQQTSSLKSGSAAETTDYPSLIKNAQNQVSEI